MATDYVKVGFTEGGGAISDGKKLDVMLFTMAPGRSMPVEFASALDGTTVMSMGTSKRSWSFVARVAVTPASGFASLSDVDGWFSSGTAAGNAFKFQDMASLTIYNVLLANKADYSPRPLSTDPHASDALWAVPIAFIEA
jgi:hypothetical protein